MMPATFPTKVADLIEGDLIIVSNGEDSHMLAKVLKNHHDTAGMKRVLTLLANDRVMTRQFRVTFDGTTMELPRVRFIVTQPI